MPKKNKENRNNLERLKRIVRVDNQTFFFSVACFFLIVLMMMSFVVLLSSLETRRSSVGGDRSFRERPIGGDKDEGGCLIGAGYSWCEAKGKCLRPWKEACDSAPLSDEDLVKRHIEANIASLAPEKSLDSSIFSVSEINLISDRTAFVGYDDGHDFYNAEAVFDILPDRSVVVVKFVVKNKNGQKYGLQSCQKDSDCVPLPSECHPHSCINAKSAAKFERPEICTMMFDPEAAYDKEDCACDLANGECFNENSTKSE